MPARKKARDKRKKGTAEKDSAARLVPKKRHW